jgi:hypothetical protein
VQQLLAKSLPGLQCTAPVLCQWRLRECWAYKPLNVLIMCCGLCQQVLENQRQLMEQQQVVIRQVIKKQQQQQQ